MLEFFEDPIQKVTAEKLRGLGIEAVLFDLDDTLIHTGEIFTRQRIEFVRTVSETTGIDACVLNDRIQELNDEEFLKTGVSPERWKVVLRRLSKEINDGGVVMDNLDIIMSIYQKEPRIIPGAKAILSGLRESNFKLGLVTHANTEWTMRKLNQTGLLNFFEVVVIANENGFKTEKHWNKCIDLLSVEANNCLVIGDNLKGDIIPSVALGARAILMPSHWSLYREGEVPCGVIQMNELRDFWDIVQKLT